MKSKRKKILICNDDGYFSWSTKHLAETLKSIADVIVVIPDRERSAVSHAISLHKPLRIREVSKSSFVVDGTPADCVRIGFWKYKDIDLVISGINNGPNLGDDVIYSGTVAGARESVLLGKPGIAVSLVGDNEKGFINAAKWVKKIILTMDDFIFSKDPKLLNINVPCGKIKGMKITVLGKRLYDDEDILEKKDPRGRKYFWLSSKVRTVSFAEDTDVSTIRNGYVSVTPLKINSTHFYLFEKLKNKYNKNKS